MFPVLAGICDSRGRCGKIQTQHPAFSLYRLRAAPAGNYVWEKYKITFTQHISDHPITQSTIITYKQSWLLFSHHAYLLVWIQTQPMKLQQKHVSNINVGKKFRLSKGFYPTQKVNFVTHDTIWHPLFDIKSNELHNKPQQVNCYLCALCHFQSLFFVRVSPCDWHKYSLHRVLSPFPEHFKKK